MVPLKSPAAQRFQSGDKKAFLKTRKSQMSQSNQSNGDLDLPEGISNKMKNIKH